MNLLDNVKNQLDRGIKVFNTTAPGSENIAFKEEVFEEINGNNHKIIIKDTPEPVIIPFLAERGNGTAVIVIPGGAFRRQVVNLEGIDVAKWLNSLGISAFVLLHRLPANDFPNREDVTLIDGQRAVRFVRANAEKWNINKDKIGVMGFSAGGHLASLLSTCFDKRVYEPADEIDRESARPDFAVLAYPAISLEAGKKATELKNVSMDYMEALFTKYSTDKLVTGETAPAFIFETDNDKTTPAEHSVNYYLACRNQGVPAELHIFKTGGHGFGLSCEGNQEAEWKRLFINWAKNTQIL